MTKPNHVKLLYVDDEFLNVKLFKAHLSREYEVLTAPSGELGLAILCKNPDISVIFSDFQMPKMNGIEFIEKAKLMRPNIKCFLLTCSNVTPEIQTALDTKLILKLIRKPFVKKHIIEIINKMV